MEYVQKPFCCVWYINYLKACENFFPEAMYTESVDMCLYVCMYQNEYMYLYIVAY